MYREQHEKEQIVFQICEFFWKFLFLISATARASLKEAIEVGIPIVGLCDTEHLTSFIDFVIPTNNKGRKAVALIYYLMAKEYLKNRGVISSDEEVSFTYEEFLERATNVKVRIIVPQVKGKRKRKRKK